MDWLRFVGLVGSGLAGVLVDRGSPYRLVVSKERVQRTHDLVNRGSFFWILAPTPFEELLDLDGEPHLLGVLRKLRPLSSTYPARNLCGTLLSEREISGEDLERQHRERKNVGRFRLDDSPASDDFRSKPHRISSGGLSCRKLDVGVKEGEPVIGQPNVAISVNEDICL